MPTPHGNAVLLEHEAEPKLVVIFVGGTELKGSDVPPEVVARPRPSPTSL